jgi:tRNA(Ile)-lysidine synthase
LQPLWNSLDAVADVVDAGCVLAVSGGPDSRALLEAFARWPRRPGRALVVAIDHGRRAGAAAEVRAVVDVARALAVDAVAVAVDAAAGDEASLRRARYAALFDAAAGVGVDVVVTAHHEGDVAEGLLLHLVGRGGGRAGRAPAVVEAHPRGRIVRPFLSVPKATLGAALAGLGVVDVVVDAADAAGENARGALRNTVLAPLGALRPDVEAALARFARQRREDDDALDAYAAALGVDVDAVFGDGVDAALPPALLRRAIKRGVAALCAGDPRTSQAALDVVVELCRTRRPGAVDVKGGVVVVDAGPAGLRVRLVRRPG